MATSAGYRVRPWPSSRTDSNNIFRVFLSPSKLLLHKISAGDVCNLETPDGSMRPVIVWPAAEKIKEDIVQTSKALQEIYSLELGCRVHLIQRRIPIDIAMDVQLYEICEDQSGTLLPLSDVNGRSHWSWLLEYALAKAEVLAPGLRLNNVECKGETRAFKVQQINLSTEMSLYRADLGCKVRIVEKISDLAYADHNVRPKLMIPNAGIGGLDKQLKQLNDIVAIYSDSNYIKTNMPTFFQPRQGGMLLYGAQGTGKSMLLRKIAEAGWQRVFHIDHTSITSRIEESEVVIASVFSDALRYQPSVIIMDSLDLIASKQEPQYLGQGISIGQVLSRQLERLENACTLAIGSTRSLTDIHQDLRGAGRFELEVEIPIPDSRSRSEILKILCNLPKDSVQSTLDDIATQTHGFVGADLKKLLGQAVKIRAVRDPLFKPDHERTSQIMPEVLLDTMKEDFDRALLRVRPTAMQEIFVETPIVRWNDIGGQRGVKEELEEAVIWPLKVNYLFKSFGAPLTTGSTIKP